MQLKLFIGTGVPAEQYAPQFLSAHGAGWRWTPSTQWHVTALFLGHRDASELPSISRSIAAVAQRTACFHLEQPKILLMPALRPTMLWIRFGHSQELTTLHHALAEATSTAPSPHSPLWPHITLARGSGALPEVSHQQMIPSLPIKELTLFRSDPSAEGTVHTPLAAWPLA